jgi:hypothetical protein
MYRLSSLLTTDDSFLHFLLFSHSLKLFPVAATNHPYTPHIYTYKYTQRAGARARDIERGRTIRSIDRASSRARQRSRKPRARARETRKGRKRQRAGASGRGRARAPAKPGRLSSVPGPAYPPSDRLPPVLRSRARGTTVVA